MQIEQFTVSRDDGIYEAWPNLALTPSGKMVCVFSECTHHCDRSFTRIVLCDSSDRGRTWTPKRALTEGTEGLSYYYNNARVMQLKDGRLAALVDRIYGRNENKGESKVVIYFSNDEGQTWSEGAETPARGIVPDKLLELESGRWILACHCPEDGFLTQRLWYSDDRGESWSDPVIVGKQQGLNLCEASILPVRDSLVAFMRENSGKGLPCYKTISHDQGETWSEPIPFPLPGCHRPVSGHLADGNILITYRMMQGGGVGWGSFQNFCGALADDEGALSTEYRAKTRIFPIDYDQNEMSDTGYSGWVQFEDGEIYVVNYIMADAEKAFIRGYSLGKSFFKTSR
jgi:sialidase-1